MKTTAEAVKHVINAGGVDTLLALDNGTGDKCGYVEGNASELAAYIDFLEANMLVPYRVQLSSSKVDRRRGNKSAQDKPYVFLLLGRSGQQHQQPVNAAPVAQAQNVPLELAKEAAANGVRNEMLTATNAELLERLKQLEDLVAERDAEDEDEEEPVNAAPPRSAFEDPEVVKEIIGIFRPIGEAAANWLSGGMKRKERITTTAQAVASAGDTLTDEERRALVAMRNAKRQDPELANQFLGQLIENYAATEPEANGQQA
jgi:hypothetical protein